MAQILMHVGPNGHSLEVGKVGWLRSPTVSVYRDTEGWTITPSLFRNFEFDEFDDSGVAEAPLGFEQVGWKVTNGNLVRDLVPTPVPTITPRQLFMALVLNEIITPEEAIAAATVGAMPAIMEGIVSLLPEEQRPLVRITWARMTEVDRNNPLVDALAAAQGHTSQDTDNLFRFAATL